MPVTRISFIGGGHMGRALLGGLIAAGHDAADLCVADPDSAQRDSARELGDVRTTADNVAATRDADVVVLGVKPKLIAPVCRDIADAARDGNVAVISVAAGVSLADLIGALGGHRRVVRIMPNTPAMVGVGAAGLYANDDVDDDARAAATALVEAVGIGVWVPQESDIDIVTGISGSGPAYFYYMMESMQRTAVELGFDAGDARRLIAQTAAGAAELARHSSDSLATMRQQVATPGGTTEAAINVLRERGFPDDVASAVLAARARSAELTQPDED